MKVDFCQPWNRGEEVLTDISCIRKREQHGVSREGSGQKARQHHVTYECVGHARALGLSLKVSANDLQICV